MSMTRELLSNAISFNRLIWIMDDETADKLFTVSERHIELVNEFLSYPTTECKEKIKDEIEKLRLERDTITQSFTNLNEEGSILEIGCLYSPLSNLEI